MFDTMRIRVKLVIALAIPLVALIGLATFVVDLSDQQATDAEARADDIRNQVALATATLGPQGIVGAIQTERNSEALALVGMDLEAMGGGSQEAGMLAPAAARAATDAAVESFRRYIAAAPQQVQDIYRPSIEAVDRLPDIRRRIDTSTEQPSMTNPVAFEAFRNYASIVRTLFESNTQVSLVVDDANLRNGAALIDLVSRAREDGSDLTYALLLAGVPLTDVEQTKTVAEAWTREEATYESIRRTAMGPYREIVEQGLNDPRLLTYRSNSTGLFRGTSGNVLALIDPSVARVWGALTELDTALADQLSNDSAAVLSAANQEALDADQRKDTVVLVGIAVLIAAAGVTYLAARSISRPLLRLARDAEDMAANRLPGAVKQILETPRGEDVVVPELDPVPTGGGIEINEVAEALNSVQASAADLAVEQALLRRNIADSFVNLGRRNQNLLSRQIDSITQMERDEADPDILERLFALDHLATRMRRNAESLLLLGGEEPHRQWSAPVPLIQVIRGAMGEVENYQRISLRELDDALVKGSAAADVTHLVAELLENALRFSPPDRDVEVIGRAVDGDYQLAIVDSGLGMSDDELERANRRLSGQESFTVAPSRYLGHYVVGVQAARLGVTVRLQHSPGSGVTARISLGDALADEAAPAATAPAAPATPAPVEPATAEAEEPEAVAPEAPAETQTEAETEVPAARHELVDEPPVERYVPPTPVAPAPAPEPTATAEVAVSEQKEDPVPATTASGYKKRQRGAHVPRTEVALARGQAADPEAAAPPADKADSVRNLLSGLQAGAERAKAESSGGASNQEDVRERS